MHKFVRSPYLTDIKLSKVQKLAAVHNGLTQSVTLLTKEERNLLCDLSTSEAISYDELSSIAPDSAEFFIGHKLLIDAEETIPHRYACLEIEINRHCNYRCTFCPVAEDPFPRGFIDEDLFVHLLDRAVEYGIELISLNHYSEPSLNPRLADYIRLIADRRMKVRLHTNASQLNEKSIRKISRTQRVHVMINLPSIDPEVYAEATGSSKRMFSKVLHNLELLAQYNVRTTIVVNSTSKSERPDLEPIKDKLDKSINVLEWKTNSRAGRVLHFDTPQNYTNELLTGCYLASNQLQVNSEGKVFLCCMDYHQEYILGDLKTQSIREVVEGDAIKKIYPLIFGKQRTPDGFICNKCTSTSKQTEKTRLLIGTHEIDPNLLAAVPTHISAEASKAGLTWRRYKRYLDKFGYKRDIEED